MNAIRNFVEYFNVSLDYLLCNDIHVVKELGQEYNMINDSKFIELEKIVTLIKNLAEDGKILLNNIEINTQQRQILLNGIDIICGLIKRETEME